MSSTEELELAEERQLPGYFAATRTFSVGLVAAIPLLLIYELGALLGASNANGIAAIFKSSISWLQHQPGKIFGADAMLIVNTALILGVIAAVVHARRLGALRTEFFVGMFGESLLYALLLGPLALAPITGRVESQGFDPHFNDLPEKLYMAAGAGFYEELFFRAVMLGAIYYIARHGAKLKPVPAGTAALIASAGIFSTAHFANPGETPNLGVFLYRLFAGIILGLIYLSRGLGVAAWTHALYDIYALCLAR